ncbi:MAG: DUF1254 domain-containing protein [Robiginitalea sp.]|uniref:DUF1254 domain-containing protein n=1 Tax=Robiginitalea sp. TaxID=1902411 RepID=UPI003C794307
MNKAVTAIPEMKMTTEIPEGIATPNTMETNTLGELNFFDGVPTPQTEEVYNYMDLHNAVDAYLKGIHIASMEAMKQGLLKLGPANTTAFLFENLMDSKSLWLTPNTTLVYMASWLELGDEPMVIETPPDVLGIIDDHYFKYVADFGRLGPDKGQGGKFLIVPPGYEGDIPQEGYFVYKVNTYGHWVIWRGFQKDGSPKPAVDATKATFKIYPLSQKDNPPAMNFVNVSGSEHNTIHRMDAEIFNEINAAIQDEPAMGENPEILGSLGAIGIKKGEEFKPDARMQEILDEAAKIGAAIVRTQMAKPRADYLYKFPGTKWLNPLAYKSYLFEHEGSRLLDARSAFHFYATGITPAMSMKIIGKGSQYAIAYSDVNGNTFDGSKTYKFHVPPNPPMEDFWSFTIYDNQTRSMLQTDQQFPGVDNNKEGLIQNEDGSWDIYIGPKAPEGFESNWIQTVPGKGWNTIFRLYGPLEPWFDGEWYPSDAVEVE